MEDQQNLIEQQALLTAIVASANDAIIGSDVNGIIIVWNNAASLLFGHAASDVLGQPFTLLFPEGQLPECQTLIKLLQQSSVLGQFETAILCKDGTELPVSLTISAIHDETDDSIKGLSFIVRDFSSMYKLAQRMTQSERRFKQVVEAAPNAMILTDELGHIEMVNEKTEQIFEYTRSELMGKPMEMLIPQRSLEGYRGLRNNYLRAQETPLLIDHNPDLLALKKDGSEFPIEIGLNPIDTDSGIHILAAIVDISERQRFIDELSRRNQELDNFVYVASHDLKSPLRGVVQLATWIEEDLAGNIGEETREHLHMMRGRVTRMEKLLDDLLLYFRADRLGGAIESVDFSELVRDVFDLCCTDRSFDLELQGSFPYSATQKVALELVFRNLINNAIKHHDKRSGHIVVRSLPAEQNFIFEVADDGRGIAPEHRERVFGMFQTLRPRDEVEGSGMGLAVIKKTIESLGGAISLGDNQPRGAVFRFSWPKVSE